MNRIIITDLADHFGLFHIIYGMFCPKKSIYKYVRQLTQESIISFRNLLDKADYSTVISIVNVNEVYDNFKVIYKSLFQISCPIKYVKVKRKYIKREPWITSGILTLSLNKAKLLRKKVNRPNPEMINKYR